MYFKTLGVVLTAFAGLVSAVPQGGYGQHGNAPSGGDWSAVTAPRTCGSAGQATATGPAVSRCYTRMASSSVPWGQSIAWSTHYTPCMSTSTITSTVTTAPPSSTTTVTVTLTTTTTAPTLSYTSTVTSTTTSTTSSTTTTTTTVTAISTTTTSVASTVPSSSGFLPIQTTDPGTTYDGAGGSSPVAKRAGFSKPKQGFSKNQYPQGISCYHYQPSPSCWVSTATTTTTVRATSTGTVTSTSTSVLTSTVVPSATVTTTTTTTATATATITSTATTTSTTTSTLTSTTTTLYAACATNNFADYLNGNGIYGGDITVGSYSVDDTTASSAYDCCVAALTDPNGSAQVWYFANGGSDCQIAIGSQCAAQSDNQWEIDAEAGSAVGTIGNAYCGEYTS